MIVGSYIRPRHQVRACTTAVDVLRLPAPTHVHTQASVSVTLPRSNRKHAVVDRQARMIHTHTHTQAAETPSVNTSLYDDMIRCTYYGVYDMIHTRYSAASNKICLYLRAGVALFLTHENKAGLVLASLTAALYHRYK